MFKNLTKKRLTILLVSLSLILVVGVGVTLAYVFASTGDVVNTFTPSKVACAVIENDDSTPHYSDTVNVPSKSNVQIKNTGDTDAYIRAAIIVTWKNEAGIVWAQKPVLGEHYSITYGQNTLWSKGDDGYWYYNTSVAPGELTDPLITSAIQNVPGPVGTDGSQYYLSIEIVASAIQSNLGNDAQSAWAEAAKGTN